MSTPATIVVHVRKEDIGRIRKCDIKKLNLRTEEKFIKTYIKLYGVERGTKHAKEILSDGYDKIPNKYVLLDTIKGIKLPEYISIYVHWNGYPDDTGKELKEKFNSYESALNLVLAGGFSCLTGGSVPYCGVGRKWEDDGPKKCDLLPECGMNYQYLFNNGMWFYREYGESDFKVL